MSKVHNPTLVPIELLRKYDRPGPRYTSYPTAPVWSDAVGADTYIEALLAGAGHPDEPLALYVHIPFCRQRCHYCGCHTVVTGEIDQVKKYVQTVSDEIELTADRLGKRNKVSQLHFGGGTPTYIGRDGLGAILQKLGDRFSLQPKYEQSIEIDPRVTTPEQIDFLAEAGFNRVSLGVQDFDPHVQEASGRVQSYESVQRVLEQCRTLNFSGINFDLIYGLPLQTVESFRTTLDLTLRLRPDRVAVYSFAYLPKLRPNQAKIIETDLPATEVKYQLFAVAVEKFMTAGYRQIGMDHFALPEDELSVAQEDGRLYRNFMGYTVQSAPDMIGFGASSIGYLEQTFFQNQPQIDHYTAALAEGRLAVYRGKALSRDDLIRQYVISSLMCNFRLDFDEFQQRFGVAYHEYFRGEHENLAGFVDDDLIRLTDRVVEITPVGRTFIRNIAMGYDAYLDNGADGKRPTFSRTI